MGPRRQLTVSSTPESPVGPVRSGAALWAGGAETGRELGRPLPMGAESRMVGWVKEYRPVLSMVAVEVFIAGMLLLSKVVLDKGMFVFAFLTYRHLVAAVFVSPFAYFLERKQRSKLTLVTVFWIFACGAFGITMGIGFYYYGILYTSASFAANFLNTIPIVTFVLAAVFRMERAGLRTKTGKVKVAGTIICVGGATMITLYKGSSFRLFPPLWHHHQPIAANTQKPNWTKGSLMLAASSLSDALWYIAQVKLLEIYPAKYSATALTCWAGTLQSFVIGFAMRRDSSAWKLGLDLELITIIYSGILTSGATFCLITWCISKRGPIYVTMFSPLVLVLVSISESFFLGERLYVGSILGSIFIIGGLYAFLWGKSKESTPEATSRKDDNQHICGVRNSEPLTICISSTPETTEREKGKAREEHKNGEAPGNNGNDVSSKEEIL